MLYILEDKMNRQSILTELSADHPDTCGVTITPGRLQRGLEEGKGSSGNTSRTAPPSHSLLKQIIWFEQNKRCICSHFFWVDPLNKIQAKTEE